MKLGTRLTLSLLGLVALVLVGFSVALYALAAGYLHRQADERLEAALNTLVAAAEVNAAGVEWEPEERRLLFGRRTVEGAFCWEIRDERGRRLDGSTPGPGDPALPTAPAGQSQARAGDAADRQGARWRVMARRLEGPGPADGSRARRAAEPGGGTFHEALVFAAGVSLAGVNDTLRGLALALAGLSVGTWGLAFLVGGRLCRRALRPVAAMAEAAHAIAGHEFDERLPVPGTGDELAGLGRAFNGLLARQHDAHRRQRRFAGDASHQLRTPLTTLQGHVDLALRHDRPAEEYRRALAVVAGKTRQLRGIVEALLFLARADADAESPRLAPVDLLPWLRDRLAARADPRATDLALVLDEGGTFPVRAEPTLLGELVANLLDNAGKYSDPGTPILVRVDRLAGSTRLTVEDRGIGIDPAELPHVLDPFYRTEAARARDGKGLGLGLAVADRIARAFGATLRVESQPGQGSTFAVIFPPVADPTNAATSRPPGR